MDTVSKAARQIPLLFLTCFVVVFAPALLGDFIYDDLRWIRDNVFIRDPRNLLDFFSPRYFAGSQEMSYRPLVTLSYFFDFALFGLKPFGYRLHNLLLHLAACALLWRVLLDITRSRAAAWWATFLFCFHPIQAEAIVIPSMREELQCTVFILISWLFFWHRCRWLAGSAAYALALLAKETALFLPLAMALGGFLERRNAHPVILPWKWQPHKRLQVILGLGAVTASYAWVRFVILRNPVEDSFHYLGGSVATSLLTHCTAWTRGLLSIVFPLNLTVEPWLPTQYSPWNFIIFSCAIVWIAFACALVWALRHNRVMAFGLGWFVTALLPVSGLVPIANVYADRYFYLPFVGLAIGFAAWLSKVSRAWSRWLVPAIACWIGLLGVLMFQRVQVFHDNPRMWNDALAKLGNKPWPLALLPMMHRTQAQPLSVLQERAASNPNDAAAWSRLAGAYLLLEDFRNATLAFQISLRGDPNNPQVHLMMGDAYARMGMPADSKKHYETALALDPKFVEAHNNLGVLLMDQKQDALSEKEFRTALALRPDFTAAMCNLATVFANRGDVKTAVSLWQDVLRIDPYNAAARWNLMRVHKEQPLPVRSTHAAPQRASRP